MERNRAILLGLTTTGQKENHWTRKVAEIDKLKIKKIALFPTVLDLEERKKLYMLLEKTGLESIPHVHLRDDDMDEKEVEYLLKRYKVKVFNLHPRSRAYAFLDRYPQYRQMTFVENLYRVVGGEKFDEASFEKHNVAGICLDLAHLQSEKILFPKKYQKRIKLLDKYPIGCNHISGIRKIPFLWREKLVYDTHFVSKISELDYLKEFPLRYFSDIISIELENSLAEQMKFREYIKNIIEKKCRQ